MGRIFIFLLSLFLLSCNNDDGVKKNNFNYSIGFDMIVKDSKGIDLLNPNTPNTLNTYKVKLFYLNNGVVEEVYNPNLDLPRNYFIYSKIDDGYRIRVFPNHAKSEEFPITYIQWDETRTDTIKCKIRYSNSAIILEKVWFNEEFKLNTNGNNGLEFEIIK